MDIAYVTDVMYPWKKGGAEKRTYEIAKRLAKNHKVTVYTMKWWQKPQKTLEYENIHLKAISPKKRLYKNNKRSISEALSFAKNTLKIQNKHDIIDFNVFPYLHCFTGKLKTLLNKQNNFVITWHEVWGNYWYDYLGKKGFIGKYAEKIASKLPNQIIAVSQKTKQDLKDLGTKTKIKVIPNGINYKEIRQIKESKQKPDITYIGRLIPEKNVDKLIKALENTSLSLAIIGDGPERQRLEKLAKKKHLKYKFYGETSYEKLISILKSSKIFALPSSREGFGITVLEAFASATPVLTVDEEKNAAKYLVNENRGKVVSLNKEAIRKGIREILEKNKKKIGKNTRKYAKKYDWDRISKLTTKAYKKLLLQ